MRIHSVLPTALLFAGSLHAQASAVAREYCPSPVGKWPGDSVEHAPPPLVATPDPVRGLYVSRWAAIGSRFKDLIALAERTEINALVIDVKDDRGLILYRSRVRLAHAISADTNRPLHHDRLRAALDTMRAHGIYPIARIVVAKDPLLAAARPAWAIRSRADTSRPWHDRQGRPWLDAHQPAVWRYAADLACEAVAFGFSEVQFDYVRFSDEDHIRRDAVFPLARGRTRARVIQEQLETMRRRLAPLHVLVTADVFGLTTTDTTDMGIGQKWERLVTAVDVILPMVYPSHYAEGAYGYENPNAHPHAVVTRALRDAKRRSDSLPGAAVIRPWYQDFTLGKPRYTASEVRAQIEAGYALGLRSWLLWNPRSVYTAGALGVRGSQQSTVNSH